MANPELKIGEMMIQRFEFEYPALDVRQEVIKMQNWWLANPRRRKKNEYRFVVNWLHRVHSSVVAAQVNARIGSQVGKFDPNGNNGRAVLSASDREWYKENGL